MFLKTLGHRDILESSPGLWFMVHGSVCDSVHGSVNGLVRGFVHDSWFILTF